MFVTGTEGQYSFNSQYVNNADIKQVIQVGNDGNGRRSVTLEGFTLNARGEIASDPRWITFNIYKPGEVNQSINASELLGYPSETVLFNYDAAAGMESGDYINLNANGTINYDNVVNRAYDFDIVNNTLVYKVRDTRWNGRSLTEIGLALDGTLKYQVFEGKILKGELIKGQIVNETKLTYNSQGLPEETYLIMQGNTEPVLHQRHYTALVNGQPGTYIVFAVDVDNGIFETIDNAVDGRQFDNATEDGVLPAGTVIHANSIGMKPWIWPRETGVISRTEFTNTRSKINSALLFLRIMILRTLLLL